MIPQAIIYTSRTGFTEQYARMLGSRLGLPVYSMESGAGSLPQGIPVIYLGWVHASHVKGFSKAKKRFAICAVCAVGLCDTGTMLAEVRKATAIPSEIPLFTLQGGFDRSRLKGINKLMIDMLIKGLSSQNQRSAQEERMLYLLQKDANYVCEEHLEGVLNWYDTLKD